MSAAVKSIGAASEVRRGRFVVALLSEPTVERACESADISYATGRRWLADPSFRAELRAAAEAHRVAVLGSITRGASEAIITLRVALRAESQSVRVRAAQALLNAHRSFLGDDLADRLDALERRLA